MDSKAAAKSVLNIFFNTSGVAPSTMSTIIDYIAGQREGNTRDAISYMRGKEKSCFDGISLSQQCRVIRELVNQLVNQGNRVSGCGDE